MIASKICSSCGAQNDIIFTNCIFCKTSLPTMNINEISNDDLIMKASEWVGKSSEGILEIRNENANEWTGKGIKRMQQGEIVANAEKYLNLLLVRATSNETLKIVYENLKSTLDKNKKIGKRKSPLAMVLYAGIAGIILFIFVMYMASGEANEQKEALKRLDKIELQIQDAIKEKNYDYALIMVEQLNYNVKLNYEENQKIAKQYEDKRNSLRSTIMKLKEQK